MIKKLADDDVKVKLAVSLHSAIDEIRSQIMPFSKNFPLADLRESLEYWYRKTKVKFPTNMLFGKILMTTKSPSMR
jgi:23S rRNA (adenine2503-C2)-methyltransferase